MPPKLEDFVLTVDEPIMLQDFAGAKRPGNIVIGAPVFYEGDERWPKCWYCYFHLEGLTGTSLVAGMSSLHSLLLAWKFIQNKLDDFIESGGKILDENGEEDFCLPHKIRINTDIQK